MIAEFPLEVQPDGFGGAAAGETARDRAATLRRMLRTVLAVVAGVVAGGIVVALVQQLGHLIWPPPAGLDVTDPEAIEAYLESVPAAAILFVALAWAVGSLAGGWIAARISSPCSLSAALIVGGVLMAFGLLNLISIPHPIWFWVVGLAVFLPAAYAGGRLAGGT